MRRELPLTIALTAAVTERVVKVGRPTVPDPNDVRMPARRPTSLVAYGQDQGVFHDFPAAQDVSTYHILSVLQRVISRREETVEETVAIVLSQLLPALLVTQHEAAEQLPTTGPADVNCSTAPWSGTNGTFQQHTHRRVHRSGRTGPRRRHRRPGPNRTGGSAGTMLCHRLNTLSGSYSALTCPRRA